MSSWVQWTARVIMPAAGVAAAGTGMSTAAFAQTGVDVPGPATLGAGWVKGTFALKLAGRGHRRIHGVPKGAMTS